jgi:hypothetical protein
VNLLEGISGSEFGGNIREISEGQFARIRFLADANVDDIIGDEITEGELAFLPRSVVAIDLKTRKSRSCFCLRDHLGGH